VNALRWSLEFADLIRERYYQDSSYGDEGKWMRGSRIETIARYVWRLNHICVPRNSKLRLRLIFDLHESQLVGHRGVDGTLAKALDMLWWKQIPQDVKGFCERCVVYRRAKLQPQMATTLFPLPVPPKHWGTLGLALAHIGA
jgi:hypothetical protein